jgi:serine/threonine-protein kinase HipA
MSVEIKNCPGTLAPEQSTYTTTALRHVFAGKKVSHILPQAAPQTNAEDDAVFVENRKHISISGVQEKMSYTQHKNKLTLTIEGEQGTHILKPIPRDLQNIEYVPANEHLTMQIASQVFGITTAANALIFFNTGQPAYITRRFDLKPDGGKLAKEDFAALAGKTEETAGKHFKYDGSYGGIAELIKRYVPASAIVLEQFYTLVVFNYLFSNGDAHLKNFALLETPSGDNTLSPAYDLLSTVLHIDDGILALEDGLYAGDMEHPSFATLGYYGYDDFYDFGLQIGLQESRIKKLLKNLIDKNDNVYSLIERSFLSNELKVKYRKAYISRHKMMTTSVSYKL